MQNPRRRNIDQFGIICRVSRRTGADDTLNIIFLTVEIFQEKKLTNMGIGQNNIVRADNNATAGTEESGPPDSVEQIILTKEALVSVLSVTRGICGSGFIVPFFTEREVVVDVFVMIGFNLIVFFITFGFVVVAIDLTDDVATCFCTTVVCICGAGGATCFTSTGFCTALIRLDIKNKTAVAIAFINKLYHLYQRSQKLPMIFFFASICHSAGLVYR